MTEWRSKLPSARYSFVNWTWRRWRCRGFSAGGSAVQSRWFSEPDHNYGGKTHL